MVPYDEWYPFDGARCLKSFFMVGNSCYDQGYWVHPFCPPEGREKGCLQCRYAPRNVAGKSNRQYMQLVTKGEMSPDGGITQEYAVQAKLVLPVPTHLALMKKGDK